MRSRDVAQFAALWQALRVEDSAPRRVRPAGDADAHRPWHTVMMPTASSARGTLRRSASACAMTFVVASAGPRDRMIQSAALLLGERGVSGTGMREIADCDAPRGSLQHYLRGGKDQAGIERLVDQRSGHRVGRPAAGLRVSGDGPGDQSRSILGRTQSHQPRTSWPAARRDHSTTQRGRRASRGSSPLTGSGVTPGSAFRKPGCRAQRRHRRARDRLLEGGSPCPALTAISARLRRSPGSWSSSSLLAR